MSLFVTQRGAAWRMSKLNLKRIVSKYLYLLERIGNRKARIMGEYRLWDAYNVEQKLLKKYEPVDVRKKPHSWFYYHIKIGISNKPKARLKDINESEFKSGFTEWRLLNWLELILLKMWIYYYRVRLLLAFIFCILLTLFIVGKKSKFFVKNPDLLKPVMTSKEFQKALNGNREQVKKSKYNSTRVVYNGNTYQSKAEAEWAAVLDFMKQTKQIKRWTRQHRLSLESDGVHITNYFIDFRVVTNEGKIELHEVKGYQTQLWEQKWNLAKAQLQELEPGAKLCLIKRVKGQLQIVEEYE